MANKSIPSQNLTQTYILSPEKLLPSSSSSPIPKASSIASVGISEKIAQDIWAVKLVQDLFISTALISIIAILLFVSRILISNAFNLTQPIKVLEAFGMKFEIQEKEIAAEVKLSETIHQMAQKIQDLEKEISSQKSVISNQSKLIRVQKIINDNRYESLNDDIEHLESQINPEA